MITRQDRKKRVDCSWSWHGPGFVQAQSTVGTELFSEPSKKTSRGRGEVANQEPSPVESESNNPFVLEAGITGKALQGCVAGLLLPRAQKMWQKNKIGQDVALLRTGPAKGDCKEALQSHTWNDDG